MITSLPAAAAQLVTSYIDQASADFSSADAMYGECETHSCALAMALDGVMITDEWDGEAPIEAWPAQKWMDRVPAALEGNEMAGGHFVTRVRIDGMVYEIDLTAAQFPEMGWTGPQVRELGY